MSDRWAIEYSYREAPDRVLTYGRYQTRAIARASLAAIGRRHASDYGAAGVDVLSPDDITVANRTAFTVKRRSRRDALGRFLAGVATVAIVARLATGTAYASEELPGSECFPDRNPATWQSYASGLEDAQLEDLDGCLTLAGWQTVDDDAGRDADWPAQCFGTGERGAWAAIRARMDDAGRRQLAECLRRAGWDGLE